MKGLAPLFYSFHAVFCLGASDFVLWSCEVLCGQHMQHQLQHEAMAKNGGSKHFERRWGETLQSLCVGHCGTNLTWCIQRCYYFVSVLRGRLFPRSLANELMILVWGEVEFQGRPALINCFSKIFKGSKQTLNHHSKQLVDCNEP